MPLLSVSHLYAAAVDGAFWPAVAREVLRALREHGLPAADTVVLLPFAELLPPARAAFAAQGGWQPRIETTRTLAASLGPTPVREAGVVTGDRPSDLLSAAAWLRSQAWGDAWASRDLRGFEQACAAVVEAAQAFARAASARAPHDRPAWWASAREQLPLLAGPGQTERMLARVALEWAALDDRAETDRLFGLRPAAWVVVRAGGADPFVAALAAATPVPVLEFDTDPPPASPFDAAAALAPPQRWLCDGFEDEAQAAARQVLLAVEQGRAPVALVALDRALVRRTHALLERVPGLRVHDESGWRLSTTRAAARVMAALRAAAPAASRDARLDWLKADGAMPGPLLDALEAAWRAGAAPAEAVEAAWGAQRDRLSAFADAGRLTVAQWVRRLADLLGPAGDDPAALQVASVLRLGGAGGGDDEWARAGGDLRLDLGGFTRWVDVVLDGAVFRPPAPVEPHVVITPLARLLLRPFAAVVCPGADDSHLGAAVEADALLGDAVAGALGLPTAADRRAREALAFAQLLRIGPPVLLRRRSDGAEPLGESPLVERAVRARVRAGAESAPELPASMPCAEVARQPVPRPAPVVTDGLPARLSATAVQALRDCPYRFFARALLRLREDGELDADPEKRDYGTWLHEVLLRFHRGRPPQRGVADDLAALRALADAVQVEQGLDPAPWLPFRAAFEDLAPRYVAWVQQRDADGWLWEAGELERERAPDAELPVRLVGRIDRIDRRQGAEGTVRQLIDYKTGSAAGLKAKVRQPLEDTQLAFYAALVGAADADTPAEVQAVYLALDDRAAPVAVQHHGVSDTVGAFLDGLADDLRDLRDGLGLAALGEGPVCEHCEVRGLCRRDHWAPGADVAGPAAEGVA